MYEDRTGICFYMSYGFSWLYVDSLLLLFIFYVDRIGHSQRRLNSTTSDNFNCPTKDTQLHSEQVTSCLK